MAWAGAPTRSALVLGGSGHLGNAVVRELLAHSYRVTVARRGRTTGRSLAGLPISDVLGDADHAATVDRWVVEQDLVVDAAAPYPWAIAERGGVAIAERRAALLIDAIGRHGARLIHFGSFVTRLGTDETGQPREPGQRLDGALQPYFAAKRAGEAVFATAARAGARITIIHPTTCLGPWDSRPPEMCLVPRVLAGSMPLVPAHIINVVDVRDVARGAVAAADHDYLRGEPLRLTGHNVAIPELCGLIGELAGVRVTTRGGPGATARVVDLAAPGAVPPMLPALWTLCHAPLLVSPAQRALGAAPRPLDVTLRDTITWYRDNGSYDLRSRVS